MDIKLRSSVSPVKNWESKLYDRLSVESLLYPKLCGSITFKNKRYTIIGFTVILLP